MQLNNSIKPPYPVLFPEDNEFEVADGYKSGSFSALLNYQYKPAENSLKIFVEMSLENQKEISKAIAEHKASYALHIENSETRFRKLVTSSTPNFDCNLSVSDLDGTIQFYPCIIATQPIKGFTSEDFNDVFAGLTFDFPVGLQLAIGKTGTINMKKLSGENQPPFTVFKNKNEKDPDLIVNTDNDNVRIGLRAEVFESYKRHCNGKYKYTGLAEIMIPVIMELLSQLGENWEKGERTLAWEQYMVNCLQRISKETKVKLRLDHGSGKGSVFWTTQQFLKSPYMMSMSTELNKTEED